MEIIWINHAGYILKHAGITLACDPWIEGKVFDNGWDLCSPTKLKYDEFSVVTHIWFSHEHPDHFNPSNIKNIDSEIRKNIVVKFLLSIFTYY